MDFRKTLSIAQLPFQKCGKYNFAQGQYIDSKVLGNIIYVLITKSKLAASHILQSFANVDTKISWQKPGKIPFESSHTEYTSLSLV